MLTPFAHWGGNIPILVMRNPPAMVKTILRVGAKAGISMIPNMPQPTLVNHLPRRHVLFSYEVYTVTKIHKKKGRRIYPKMHIQLEQYINLHVHFPIFLLLQISEATRATPQVLDRKHGIPTNSHPSVSLFGRMQKQMLSRANVRAVICMPT